MESVSQKERFFSDSWFNKQIHLKLICINKYQLYMWQRPTSKQELTVCAVKQQAGHGCKTWAGRCPLRHPAADCKCHASVNFSADLTPRLPHPAPTAVVYTAPKCRPWPLAGHRCGRTGENLSKAYHYGWKNIIRIYDACYWCIFNSNSVAKNICWNRNRKI